MSPDVKQFIGKGAVFMLCLIVVIGGIEWRLRQNLQLHTRLHYQALFEKPSDVLVLGSSRALHSIQPAVLQTISHPSYDFSSTMNFSLAGATSSYWRQWVEHLLPLSAQQPSLVILSVNRLSAPRRIEQDSHFFPVSALVKLAFKPEISQSVLLKNSLLSFAINKRLAYLLKPEKTGWWQKIDEYDRGYVPIDLEMAEGHTREYNASNETYNQTEIAAIRGIVNRLQTKGITVVFVRTPSYLTVAPDEVHNTFTAAVAELAQEKGIVFLNYDTNYRSSISTTREYFKDWMHMRRPGATAFSEVLKKDLAELPVK